MLNKTMFALAAAFAVGSASAAFAYDPENLIGDRYPFLEQRTASAPAKFAGIRVMARNVASIHEIGSWDPENQIADRYPLLERTAVPAVATNVGMRVRLGRQVSFRAPVEVEDPENRIGDKYPMLEPVYGQRGTAGVATAGRMHRAARRKV